MIAPLAMPMPSPSIPWFKTPFGHWDWIRSARKLWEWLKLPEHNGATTFKYKDWELAQILGVGRRCIQAALHFLEHVAGVIRRYKEYGHHPGRVIEIIIPLAGPKAKARPAPAKPAAPTIARSTAIPNVPPIPATTPEQLAQHEANLAEAEAGPAEEEPDAGAAAAAEAFWGPFRKRARENIAKEEARKARVAGGVGQVPSPGKKTAEQQKAELDAWRRANPPADDPGMPRPARE